MGDFKRLYDANLQLLDSQAITTTDNAQVGGSDQILDVGSGLFEGTMNVNVTAIVINDDTELYQYKIQGSSSATFASTIVDLGVLELGANEVLSGDQDSTTGTYSIPFTNEQNGTRYRYLRLQVVVSGDSPSITSEAWISQW